MKKKPFFLLAIILGLIFVLAACGTSTSEETATSGETAGTEPLRVVTNAAYAPFEYMEGDKIVGFDIDLINALAEEAGYEIEIEHVGWDPLFVEIESERADLAIGAITINDDRKQTYDFSHPYFLSTNKILVPEDSTIQSGEDLVGLTVAVQGGTTGDAAVEKLFGTNHQDIKKFEDNNLAIQELLQGGAEAVVADNTVVEEYVKNNPDQKLKVVEDSSSFEQEFYGFMFPKGSELKADFDEALNTLFENGTYAEIYEEWFGVEPDLETIKAQQ
ncbi:amino acid ABC transporter substrate-binding protein (PAAT family) [Bacillus oleivorans]|uniref:Amino acid ABC transporter substrate-binding protein (PAAT family) n=1 Tax=Bacillus oleivorans TaxID=1448271 RepID=A0A285CJW3_9BACI|nr:basic amino acid ABC transporter substrate-binding protein [Bacillus oleivorans]SNX67296.1 amino acid ABC transporter substrate-binding protein (PAAT family) [Bacillus oleivorans]